MTDYKTHPLNYPTIVRLAKDHGIKTKQDGGAIFFLDEGFQRDDNNLVTIYEEWIDVTTWSVTRTRHWLGY